jgi:hypothetical protein
MIRKVELNEKCCFKIPLPDFQFDLGKVNCEFIPDKKLLHAGVFSKMYEEL